MAVEDVFKAEALSLNSIMCLATIDKKADEQGLKEAAAQFGVPLYFYEAESLNEVKVPNPSGAPQKYVGAKSVCEAAAILGAGQGELIVQKKKLGNVTVAVALAV